VCVHRTVAVGISCEGRGAVAGGVYGGRGCLVNRVQSDSTKAAGRGPERTSLQRAIEKVGLVHLPT
jgi:hypothetical protein